MTALTHDPQALAFAADDDGKSLADYVAILRRWMWLLLTTLVLLLVASTAVALLLPAVYRSTATILIKEQEIPQELVRSTVTSFADERIQVISQQVMTRATLLDLVDKYGLYGKARQRETSEEILDRMRRDIKLTPISADVTDRRTGSPVKSTIAFTLSYDSEVAADAQKIANELTTLFLNENVKNRQQKAAETTSFLDEELSRVTVHIGELEQKLSDFKRRNQGRTPDLSLANQVGSERAETDLQRIERDIAFMTDRKLQLESQLADTKPILPLASNSGTTLEPEERLRTLQIQLTTLTGQYSENHPDVKRLRREIASLQADSGAQAQAGDRETALERLRAELAALRKRYSDDHPDVIKLKRTYAALEQAVKAEADARPELPRPRKPDNPTWINLKAQIATTESQIDSLTAERKELRTKRDQLSSRLSQSPEVEREFLELVRDMDSSRAQFRELRAKQMQAQVAEQLERSRKAERFTIIEPPIFPEKPNRPNRQLILLMGVALAIGGAFASVAIAQSLDQSVQGAKDVIRAMQVPVLVVLPAALSLHSLRRRRRARWLLALAALMLLAAGLALVHLFYMPLDVAWFGLLRRLAN